MSFVSGICKTVKRQKNIRLNVFVQFRKQNITLNNKGRCHTQQLVSMKVTSIPTIMKSMVVRRTQGLHYISSMKKRPPSLSPPPFSSLSTVGHTSSVSCLKAKYSAALKKLQGFATNFFFTYVYRTW